MEARSPKSAYQQDYTPSERSRKKRFHVSSSLWWFQMFLGLWEHPSNLRSCRPLVAQLYPTLCSPMDCRPLGSSDHGILQARILEWIAIPSSVGSSKARDWTQVSRTAGRFFTAKPPGEPNLDGNCLLLCESFWFLIICTRLFITHGKKFRKYIHQNQDFLLRCYCVESNVFDSSICVCLLFSAQWNEN